MPRLPVVEETEMTLGDYPVIRVDGFFFIGDLEARAADPELTRWASDRKTIFIYKGHHYSRVDQSRSAIEYFDLTPHFCDEVLSGVCSAADKG